MLCNPVSYLGSQPVIVEFPMQDGARLAIRYLSVDWDLEAVYDSYIKHVEGHWDLKGLLQKFRESFTYMASSNSSQAFMITLENESIFEIEVHEISAYPIAIQNHNAISGDYVLNLLGGYWDKTTPSIYGEAIKFCLRYFHRFEEIKRIILDDSFLEPAFRKEILSLAGFISEPGQPVIYIRGL